MTNIALDTNIWIYLTKDTFYELWLKLKEMKEKDEIRIIVNDVLLLEWERNKGNTIDTLITNLKNEYSSAKNLSHYLDEPHKTDYLRIVSEYKDEEIRVDRAKKRVEEVETFMKSCKIIEVTEEQKMFIANLAINKKAPFQNNKNNFNDALILRNIFEYSDNTIPNLYDLIYVSNNPDDFIDKATSEVHSTILEGLNPKRLKNVKDLGHALHLAPELIADFDDWLDYQLESYYDYDTMMNR